MFTRLRSLVIGALCIGAAAPLCAQKPVKLPSANLTAPRAAAVRTPKLPTNKVYLQALRHAQALRQIQLNRSIPNAAAPLPAVTIPTAPAGQEIPRGSAKSAQQWLNLLEEYVAQKGRFPRASRHHEDAPLYVGISNILRTTDPQDPVAVRIREIRQQYSAYKTPQERLAMLEDFVQENGRMPRSVRHRPEGALYISISSLLRRLDAQDPIAVRIRALSQAHMPLKTPPQWLAELETFIQQHGRFPISSPNHEEYVLYTNVFQLARRLDPQDPITQRIRQLREQYPGVSHRPGKLQQEWLNELETFIQQHHRFPLSSPGHPEYLLYANVFQLTQRLGPQDPITKRIWQLREEYPRAVPNRGKSPQAWLDELESFIQQHGRFPAARVSEERLLYRGVFNVLDRLDAQDPIALRIRQLRETYPGKK